MGWAFGTDRHGRDVGYGVEAVCDEPGCEAKIDRGLAYVCGASQPDGGDHGCGYHFCGEHLYGAGYCARCKDKGNCDDCGGEGHYPDGEPCETCDSLGYIDPNAEEDVAIPVDWKVES